MMVGDLIGSQRGIHHQFANPIAFRLLLAQQKALGPLDSGFQFILGGCSRGWLTWRVPETARTH